MAFNPGISLSFGTEGLDRMREFYTLRDDKIKEEQKKRAREFKALQEYADVRGMIPKDASTTMDLDSLRGHVEGRVAEEKLQEVQAQNMARLGQYQDAMRRAQADEAMRGAAGVFAQEMGPTRANLADYYENPENYSEAPQASSLDAMISAVSQYPGAAADERFNAFISAADRARFGAAEKAAAAQARSDSIQGAITDRTRETTATKHANQMERDAEKARLKLEADTELLKLKKEYGLGGNANNPRFVLTDKDKLLMSAELEAAKKYADPDALPKIFAEINQKYSALAIKPQSETKSDERVKVQSPSGKVGNIPKGQLEDALKQGYKVVQ